MHDTAVHSAAQYQMMSGRVIPGFPAIGSWLAYGLGTESDSLPAYVVMPDPHGAPEAGQPMYTNGFLPAVYQPAMFRAGKSALNLELPEGIGIERRRKTIDFLRNLNEANNGEDPSSPRASPPTTRRSRCKPKRLRSSTCRMSRRRCWTSTASARRTPITTACWCLLARRLIEKGVAYICVVAGGGGGETEWDAHSDIERTTPAWRR